MHPRIFQNSEIFYLFLSTWYPQQILQNIQCIVQVVDLEPLVAKFGHPSQYLRDNIHPHMFLNMEIFNIYLNILRDHGHFAPQAQSMWLRWRLARGLTRYFGTSQKPLPPHGSQSFLIARALTLGNLVAPRCLASSFWLSFDLVNFDERWRQDTLVCLPSFWFDLTTLAKRAGMICVLDSVLTAGLLQA